MWIYIITFITSCGLFYIGSKNTKDQSTLLFKKICNFIGILIPVLVAAFRADSVGTDVRNYVEPLQQFAGNNQNYFEFINYNGLLSNGEDFTRFEKGYVTFAYLCSKISNTLFCNLFFTELIILLSVFFGLKKFKQEKESFSMWVGMLIFFTLFYNLSLNMVRQSIAMFILLYGFHFLQEKKWKAYCLTVFVAMLFHATAIFGFLVLFLYYYLENNNLQQTSAADTYNSSMLIRTLIVSFIASVLFLFPNLFKNLITVIGLSKFSGYLQNNVSISINKIILKLPFLLLLIIQWKYLKNNKLKFFYLAMSIIDIALFQLSSASEFSSRISWYSTMYYIYSVPDELSVGNRNRRLILTTIMCLYFIIYWYNFSVLRNYNETVPYIFS